MSVASSGFELMISRYQGECFSAVPHGSSRFLFNEKNTDGVHLTCMLLAYNQVGAMRQNIEKGSCSMNCIIKPCSLLLLNRTTETHEDRSFCTRSQCSVIEESALYPILHI